MNKKELNELLIKAAYLDGKAEMVSRELRRLINELSVR